LDCLSFNDESTERDRDDFSSFLSRRRFLFKISLQSGKNKKKYHATFDQKKKGRGKSTKLSLQEFLIRTNNTGRSF
jgi:hypothetical protein